jgi:hypothetical protein
MDSLRLQLLAWISDRPRTYGEVMEAWHTTCPRMPVWEDAVSDGLVQFGTGTMRERSVGLTPRGETLLNGILRDRSNKGRCRSEPWNSINGELDRQHDEGSVNCVLVQRAK